MHVAFVICSFSVRLRLSKPGKCGWRIWTSVQLLMETPGSRKCRRTQTCSRPSPMCSDHDWPSCCMHLTCAMVAYDVAFTAFIGSSSHCLACSHCLCVQQPALRSRNPTFVSVVSVCILFITLSSQLYSPSISVHAFHPKAGQAVKLLPLVTSHDYNFATESTSPTAAARTLV